MLSGNTDCYQTAERLLKITRSILEVLWKYRHPVGIITKNSLILRDLDILKKMNEHNLVHVSISITTLDEQLRMLLEPRTANIKSRLKVVEELSAAGIPVNVMMAPIIPGLNDHEIFQMVKTVADLGARNCHYTMVRLNGDVATIFTDWIQKAMPDRAEKVLNKIKAIIHCPAAKGRPVVIGDRGCPRLPHISTAAAATKYHPPAIATSLGKNLRELKIPMAMRSCQSPGKSQALSGAFLRTTKPMTAPTAPIGKNV